MAQSAVAAIKSGCQMLSEGRQEIGKLKKTVEQGIGDAKAIYKEITGIWGWIKGLFGSKPVRQIEAPKPAPKKKAPEPELSYEEYQTRAVHQVCEQLKTFFEIKRQLHAHCHELEEISKTTDRIEDSAIDRVQIEMQLENMTVQIREAMVYAPKELRDIYSRFLKMYDQILEEQEFARQVRRKQTRDAKWQRELLRNHRIDRAVVTVTVLLAVLWMWAMLLSLGWLVRTPDGLSLLS
jgi:dsDNA-specific endonuclease/ATPase MutS2